MFNLYSQINLPGRVAETPGWGTSEVLGKRKGLEDGQNVRGILGRKKTVWPGKPEEGESGLGRTVLRGLEGLGCRREAAGRWVWEGLGFS